MKKIAVIELNMLSLKLTIAAITKQNSVVVLEQIKEPINYLVDVEADGIIKASKINDTVQICQGFKSILDKYEVVETKCLAYRSFYNVKNETSFFEQVYNKCDLKFTEMTDEDEATAFYFAAVNSIDVSRATAFVVNLHDTIVLSYSKRCIFDKAIIPYGSLNILNELESGLEPSAICEKIAEIFTPELKKVEWLEKIEPESTLIGLGNDFLNVCKLTRKVTKYPLELENAYVLTKENFDTTYKFLKGLELSKATKIKGISADRADLILSAFAIYDAIFNHVKANNIVASKLGFSEGELNAMCNPSVTDKVYSDILGANIETINNYYDVDPKFNEHVYNLAVILFKQLKVLHKLPRAYVKALRIAANMYNCGHRISAYETNKSAYQVVLHSNLMGVSHKDILLGAFTLLCFNLDDFNLAEWVKYKNLLAEEDMDAVKKLSVLVRLAMYLDRFNRKKILDITCDILGDSIIVKTQTDGNANMELREGKKIDADFKKVFKKNLELL